MSYPGLVTPTVRAVTPTVKYSDTQSKYSNTNKNYASETSISNHSNKAINTNAMSFSITPESRSRPSRSSDLFTKYEWITPIILDDIPRLYQRTNKWKESCTTIASAKSIYRLYQISTNTRDQVAIAVPPIATQILNYLLFKIPGKIKPEEIEYFAPFIPIMDPQTSEQKIIEIVCYRASAKKKNILQSLIKRQELLMGEVAVKSLGVGTNSKILSDCVGSDPTHIVNVDNISKDTKFLWVHNHWDSDKYEGIEEDFPLESNCIFNVWYWRGTVHDNKPKIYNIMSYESFCEIRQDSAASCSLLRFKKIFKERGIHLNEQQIKVIDALHVPQITRNLYYPFDVNMSRFMYESRCVMYDVLSLVVQQLKETNKSNINTCLNGFKVLINNDTNIKVENLTLNISAGRYYKLPIVSDDYRYNYDEDDSKQNEKKKTSYTGSRKTQVLKRWHKTFFIYFGVVKKDGIKDNNHWILNAPYKWQLESIRKLLAYLPDKGGARQNTESVISELLKLSIFKQEEQTKSNSNNKQENDTFTPTYCPTYDKKCSTDNEDYNIELLELVDDQQMFNEYSNTENNNNSNLSIVMIIFIALFTLITAFMCYFAYSWQYTIHNPTLCENNFTPQMDMISNENGSQDIFSQNDKDTKLMNDKLEWLCKCDVAAQIQNVSTMFENINNQDDNEDPYKEYQLFDHDALLLYFEGDPIFKCKDELLNNQIFKLIELQYYDLLFQAEFCTAFNRGGAVNEQYDMEPCLPLSIICNSEEMCIINSELHNYLLTLHDDAFKPFTILCDKRCFIWCQ